MTCCNFGTGVSKVQVSDSIQQQQQQQLPSLRVFQSFHRFWGSWLVWLAISKLGAFLALFFLFLFLPTNFGMSFAVQRARLIASQTLGGVIMVVRSMVVP